MEYLEEHQQQLAAAEARIAEAEARASEAEARAAATTEMHEADSEQAGALKSAWHEQRQQRKRLPMRSRRRRA